MPLTQVTAPVALPFTLTEAKAHLRVDHGDEDALIAALMAAAVQHFDGPDASLNRAIMTQTWRLTLPEFPDSEIPLPLPPLQSVTTVTYRDTTGAVQTLAGSAYIVVTGGTQGGGVLRTPSMAEWPETQEHPEAVAITFVCGYAGAIPAPLRAAMLLVLGDLYANREAQTDKPLAENLTASLLAWPYRVSSAG